MKSTEEIFRNDPELKSRYLFEEKRVAHLLQASLSVKGKSLLDDIQGNSYHKLTDRSTSIHFILLHPATPL